MFREDSPHKRIHLHHLHIIQRLQRPLYLPLVRLDITNKHQRIILLNLLHCAFRVKRVDQDFVMIQSRLMGDGFSWIFGRS